MIKSFNLLIIFILSSTLLMAQDGIQFDSISWSQAFDRAEKQEKLIFLEGYVAWSEPCADLEDFVFTDPEVGAYFNQHFVNMRLDMEDFPGSAVAEAYEITSYPTMLFIAPDGEIIHRGCGAVSTGTLLKMGKEAVEGNHLTALQQKFESGERSLGFLETYSRMLQNACLETSPIAEAYFDETPQSEWLSAKSWEILRMNVNDPYSPVFQYLLAYHDRFALEFGKDTVDEKINNVLLDQLISIYEGVDQTLFASQALKSIIEKVEFKGKEPMLSLVGLKIADQKRDWESYAQYAQDVVEEQEVSDPDQLNDFAWKFYLYVEEKPALQAALEWMKDVIDQYNDATYLDTYASLSYRLGMQKQAVKFGKKALKAAIDQRLDLEHYRAQLAMYEDDGKE